MALSKKLLIIGLMNLGLVCTVVAASTQHIDNVAHIQHLESQIKLLDVEIVTISHQITMLTHQHFGQSAAPHDLVQLLATSKVRLEERQKLFKELESQKLALQKDVASAKNNHGQASDDLRAQQATNHQLKKQTEYYAHESQKLNFVYASKKKEQGRLEEQLRDEQKNLKQIKNWSEKQKSQYADQVLGKDIQQLGGDVLIMRAKKTGSQQQLAHEQAEHEQLQIDANQASYANHYYKNALLNNKTEHMHDPLPIDTDPKASDRAELMYNELGKQENSVKRERIATISNSLLNELRMLSRQKEDVHFSNLLSAEIETRNMSLGDQYPWLKTLLSAGLTGGGLYMILQQVAPR